MNDREGEIHGKQECQWSVAKLKRFCFPGGAFADSGEESFLLRPASFACSATVTFDLAAITLESLASHIL